MNSFSSIGSLPVVLAFILVLSAAPASAQVSIEPGVKIGGNLATWRGDDVSALSIVNSGIDLKRRTGLLIGGFALVDFAGPFALQPELLYVQKGAKIEGTAAFGDALTDVSTTYKVDYLELPVLAKLQIPVVGPASPNVFAGPAFGVKLSERIEMEQWDASGREDAIKNTDVEFVIGGGMDVGLAAGTLAVDLRYAMGMSNIPSEGDSDVKNGGIMLTAGFRF